MADEAKLDTPFGYATLSVTRRLRPNLPVYAALSVSVALPCLALLLVDPITAQGAALGGAETADAFAQGARAIAGMAALVGIIQIALLLARILAQRTGEHRLLRAIAMTPAQLMRMTLWETLFHALLGYMAGFCLVTVIITCFQIGGVAPGPSGRAFVSSMGIGIAISLVAMIIPQILLPSRRLLIGQGDRP